MPETAEPGWYEMPVGPPQYWDGRAWSAGPQAGSWGGPPLGGVPSGWSGAHPGWGSHPVGGTSSAALAVVAHLAGFFSVFATLIVYLVADREDPFTRHHAAEALNFHITVSIAFVAIVILAIPTFGLALLAVLPLGVVWIAWPIKAAVAASRFQPWRYPVSLRFVH